MAEVPQADASVTCPHLRETFHNPLTCMYCVPTNVRHCCRKHETEDLKGSIFGRNFIVCPICWDKRCAHADDCANDCTGQQPATLSEFVHAPDHMREHIGNDVARRVDARITAHLKERA